MIVGGFGFRDAVATEHGLLLATWGGEPGTVSKPGLTDWPEAVTRSYGSNPARGILWWWADDDNDDDDDTYYIACMSQWRLQHSHNISTTDKYQV